MSIQSYAIFFFLETHRHCIESTEEANVPLRHWITVAVCPSCVPALVRGNTPDRTPEIALVPVPYRRERREAEVPVFCFVLFLFFK